MADWAIRKGTLGDCKKNCFCHTASPVIKQPLIELYSFRKMQFRCIFILFICSLMRYFVAVCTANKAPFLTDIAYISGRYDKHYLAENPENAQPIR